MKRLLTLLALICCMMQMKAEDMTLRMWGGYGNAKDFTMTDNGNGTWKYEFYTENCTDQTVGMLPHVGDIWMKAYEGETYADLTNGSEVLCWRYNENDPYNNNKKDVTVKLPDDYKTTNYKVTITASDYNATNHGVKLTIAWEATSTPTPVTPTTTETSLYMVGSFMSGETNINYTNKIFRLKPIGNNQYTIDLPATITANCQIVDESGNIYGPNANGGSYDLHANGESNKWPADNGEITDQAMTTGNSSAGNSWYLTSRAANGYSDGMYTFTITTDDNGVPTTWAVKHTLLTRVVYFLPNNGVAQPAYMTRNNSSAGDNKYFGNVYLDADQECFILGNIKGKSVWTDSGKPMPTTDKLYRQGNGGGYVLNDGTQPASHTSGYDDWTKVYPALSTGFKFGNAGAYTLEYNPSKGQDEKEKYTSNSNIGGEVLRAAGDPLPAITAMQVIGDGVGTTDWNLANALDMDYNSTLKCWEITINTTAAAGGKFRFVANGSWDTNWYENGTADSDKARIPYNEAGTGHAATDSDPNAVEKTDDAHATTERDIIFNRPSGTWTIRFYIETESTSGGNFFTYNYYYTINGEENVPVELTYRHNKFIRTFSSAVPLNLATGDFEVRAYEAYRFIEGDKATNAHGTVELRRLKYIPANMGVVLIGSYPAGNTYTDSEKLYFNLKKRTDESATTEAEYPKVWYYYDDIDSYATDSWNNYLVPTVTAVTNLGNAAVEGGVITHRYFGLGHYYATSHYNSLSDKSGVEDYIGFFRLTENGRSGANKAYLSLPADNTTEPGSVFGALTFNGQLLDDQEVENNTNESLARTAILFDDDIAETMDNGNEPEPIAIDEPTANAISTINTDRRLPVVMYNMAGQRVGAAYRGMVIVNGKKIVKQ